LNLRPLD